MHLDEFTQHQPHFALEDYFHGETRAYGLFEDRFGRVRKQFSVLIDGHWDGQTLTLDEDFIYDNGDSEYRHWQIEKTGPRHYVGTTQQIIGTAEGEISGNSFHWTYRFHLKVGKGIWDVRFDDWMYLQPDGVLLNKATVYRWGIKIGTVFLTFSKGRTAGRDRTGDLAVEEIRAAARVG